MKENLNTKNLFDYEGIFFQSSQAVFYIKSSAEVRERSSAGSSHFIMYILMAMAPFGYRAHP